MDKVVLTVILQLHVHKVDECPVASGHRQVVGTAHVRQVHAAHLNREVDGSHFRVVVRPCFQYCLGEMVDTDI